MSDSTTVPTFNMKVVVQETGLKPDTLRAWERRYGVPSPERTAGGHRLYSQYEIDMLKWLIARQEEGLSISHAIELWQQLRSEGQDPLASYGQEMPASSVSGAVHVMGDRIDTLREAWIEACLSFQEFAAQQILAQAFAFFPPETVCVELLQKGLREIGCGWYEGRVSVQQEHFASALAVRQLEALRGSLASTVRQKRVLLACPPHEEHTFSLLLLTVLLRWRGMDVVYLGANVPLARLDTSVAVIRPQLVVAAAQTLPAAGMLMDMAQLLRQVGVPLAYGGWVFNQIPALPKRIPGFFLGEDLPEAAPKIESWLQSLPSPPEVVPVSAAYELAMLHFQERRAAIEAYLYGHAQAMLQMGTTRSLLLSINRELGNSIEAALRLGDMALLSSDIDWIQGFLTGAAYGMPAQILPHYLSLYLQAATATLDKRGEPLLDWLRQASG